MSSIQFVGGEKGGVGKSVLARLLAQYHIDRDLPFRAFDSDRSHGAMLRFYGDYSAPVTMDIFDNADRIMEAALEQPPRNVIVDLAAQTALPLFQWIDDNDLLSLAADEGIGVVFWHVLDDGADSIKLLRDLLKRLDGREQLVVVRNFGRGNQFAAFDDSVEHTDAVQAGVHIIDLPALHQATMRKVDHLGASFWAAANNRDSLSVMDRQRVKVWLRRVYASLDQIADALLLTHPAADTPAPDHSAEDNRTTSETTAFEPAL
ncbi:MAG: hypothetical protein N838_21215 [Thiohalocapsa sp. PB-PSB1]|nr:MAG: hypothetical protein N838_21215 [Thiohalocapsa sp. PB-PSB1]